MSNKNCELITVKILASVFGFWPIRDLLDEDEIVKIEVNGLEGIFTKKQIYDTVYEKVDKMGLEQTSGFCIHDTEV